MDFFFFFFFPAALPFPVVRGWQVKQWLRTTVIHSLVGRSSTTILVIIFWHFLIIQHRSESPQINEYLISSITNLVQELPHKLPNNLRLRILGNQKILEKCQVWVEMQPSAQSSFHELNFDNSCQKTHKIRKQIFEVLSNFTGFLYFMPNILSRIVVATGGTSFK